YSDVFVRRGKFWEMRKGAARRRPPPFCGCVHSDGAAVLNSRYAVARRMSGHQFPMAIPQPPGRARVRLGMELLDLASVGARENPAADLAVTGLTPVAALKLGGVDNSRHWQSFHLSIELIRSLYTIGVGGDSPAISRTGSALILSRCRPITPARTSSRYRPRSAEHTSELQSR